MRDPSPLSRAVATVALTLAIVVAGCAHRSVDTAIPPADGFFTSTPPQGTLSSMSRSPAPKPGTPASGAAASPSDTTLFPFTHVDELPEVISKVPPAYPDSARRARVHGTVMTQAFVKTDGTVGDVRVTKSIPLLDEAAVECVRQWRFKPALAAKAPVAVWVAVPVKFNAP